MTTKLVVLFAGHSFGYASLVLDDKGGALISWLEQGGETTRILVRRVGADGVTGPVKEIAQGSKQSLGYPRLWHRGSETWIAWGNSETAKIQSARLTK